MLKVSDGMLRACTAKSGNVHFLDEEEDKEKEHYQKDFWLNASERLRLALAEHDVEE